MEKQLKSIDLVMENCEVFKVYKDNIDCFYLDEIIKDIRAYSCHDGRITEHNGATTFAIWIDDIDKVEKSFSYQG